MITRTIFYMIYKYSAIAKNHYEDEKVKELYKINRKIDKEIKKKIKKKKYKNYHTFMKNFKKLYNFDYFLLDYLSKSNHINEEQKNIINELLKHEETDILPEEISNKIHTKIVNSELKIIYEDGIDKKEIEKYYNEYNNKTLELQNKVINKVIKPILDKGLGIENKELEKKWKEIITNNFFSLWI